MYFEWAKNYKMKRKRYIFGNCPSAFGNVNADVLDTENVMASNSTGTFTKQVALLNEICWLEVEK